MISQGIGGGDIQTFETMGKSQMSKGEPIKLSITHFVFCAQSFRNWLRKLMHGMGRVCESNSNLGSHPFLENMFLNSWGSK